MNMKVALYARVSTKDKDQNPETQLRLLRQEAQRLGYEIYQEYVDTASALDIKHRTAWRELMAAAKARKFQVVLVYKLDRAFRSITHLHLTLMEWSNFGVSFKSYSDPIDNITATGRLLLNITASYAEFERDILSERVRAGMARAKEKGTLSGKAIGRPRNGVGVQNVLNAFTDTGTIRGAARKLGITPGLAFHRLVEAGAIKNSRPKGGMNF